MHTGEPSFGVVVVVVVVEVTSVAVVAIVFGLCGCRGVVKIENRKQLRPLLLVARTANGRNATNDF